MRIDPAIDASFLWISGAYLLFLPLAHTMVATSLHAESCHFGCLAGLHVLLALLLALHVAGISPALGSIGIGTYQTSKWDVAGNMLSLSFIIVGCLDFAWRMGVLTVLICRRRRRDGR
jgi:hypothetical protein